MMLWLQKQVIKNFPQSRGASWMRRARTAPSIQMKHCNVKRDPHLKKFLTSRDTDYSIFLCNVLDKNVYTRTEKWVYRVDMHTMKRYL